MKPFRQKWTVVMLGIIACLLGGTAWGQSVIYQADGSVSALQGGELKTFCATPTPTCPAFPNADPLRPGRLARSGDGIRGIWKDTGTAWTPIIPLIRSRADALSLRLSNFDAIRTDGYTTAGDGGGGLFKNVGATALLDTGASFTDAGGINWQYIPGPEGIHVTQFGAVFDWTPGSDATATNNTTAINNAITYAAIPSPTASLHKGAVVWLPKGTGLIGNGSTHIWVKDGVTLKGLGTQATILRLHGSFDQSTHAIWLGNKSSTASFDTRLESLQIQALETADASLGSAVIYSNNVQHTGGLRDVLIYGGHRVCVYFEIGYGGASYVTLDHVETHNNGAAGGLNNNQQIILDYGTTIIYARNLVVQGPSDLSGGASQIGLEFRGGILDLVDFHSESVAIAIKLTLSADDTASLSQVTGGVGVTSLIQIDSTSTTQSRRYTFERIIDNGSTTLVQDARTNGINVTDENILLRPYHPFRSLVAGDIVLSAGWGSTATVSAINGTDQRFRFTVTSAGTGQGVNPTATLTFKDGTWTTAPFAVCSRNGGNQPAVLPTWTTTATTLVITFPGTPVAAETYTLECVVMG